MSKHLFEDHAGVERNVLIFVALQGLEDNITPFAKILDGGPSAANLASEKVVEDVHYVLA